MLRVTVNKTVVDSVVDAVNLPQKKLQNTFFMKMQQIWLGANVLSETM